MNLETEDRARLTGILSQLKGEWTPLPESILLFWRNDAIRLDWKKTLQMPEAVSEQLEEIVKHWESSHPEWRKQVETAATLRRNFQPGVKPEPSEENH
jgi:hypothetical protein